MGCAVPSNARYFTMVVLDEDDKPKQVPHLILETESAARGMESGRENGVRMRMRRKEEGF